MSVINWPATIGFSLICLLAGAGAVLLLQTLRAGRRPQPRAARPPESQLDAETAEVIDRAAQDWASRTGRTPFHADIAGSYAKMAVDLQQRPRRFRATRDEWAQ